MPDRKSDPSSDAERSDPKKAEANREELKKQAEQGIKNATHDLPKEQG
ncbi:hypothetical protein [Neorhizobium sp. DT-125]